MNKFLKVLMLLIFTLTGTFMFACNDNGNNNTSGNAGTSVDSAVATKIVLDVKDVHMLENSRTTIGITILPSTVVWADADISVSVNPTSLASSCLDEMPTVFNRQILVKSKEYNSANAKITGIRVRYTNEAKGVYLDDYFDVTVYGEPVQLSVPQNLSYNYMSNTVVWNSVRYANGYKLNVNGTNYQVSGTSFVLPDTIIGKQLTMKVMAVYDFDNEFPVFKDSVYSDELSFMVLSTPKNIAYNNGVVTWDKVDGATTYSVTVNAKAYEVEATDSQVQSLRLDEFVNAGTYTIKIKADAKNSVNVYGTQNSAPVYVTKLNAPQNISMASGTYSWSEVEGSNGYILKVEKYNELSEEWIETGYSDTLTETYFTFPASATAGKYRLSLTTLGDGKRTLTSNISQSTITEKLVAPTEVKVENGILKWKGSENAKNYILNIIENGQVVTLEALQGEVLNTYMLNGLTLDAGTYNVTLTASNDQYIYFDSNPTTAISFVKLQTPEISFIKENATYRVEWNNVENATTYELDIDGNKYMLDTNKYYIDAETTQSGTHTVSVKSTGSENVVYSNQSKSVSFSKLYKPTNIRVANGVLRFDDSRNTTVANYRLVYSNSSSDGVVNLQVETNYNFSGMEATTYRVQIKAEGYDNDNVIPSEYSDSIIVTKLQRPSAPYIENGNFMYDEITLGDLKLEKTQGNGNPVLINPADFYVTGTADLKLRLKAVGNSGEDGINLITSEYSETLSSKILGDVTDVYIENGILHFTLPEGASEVEFRYYKTNSIVPFMTRTRTLTAGASTLGINDVDAGDYKIMIKAITGSGTYQSEENYIHNGSTKSVLFTKLDSTKSIFIAQAGNNVRKAIESESDRFTTIVRADFSARYSGYLCWESVVGASSYTLRVNGRNEILLNSSDYITNGSKNYYYIGDSFTKNVTYKFEIRANGDANNSSYITGDYSSQVSATKIGNMTSIEVKDGKIYFGEQNANVFYEVTYLLENTTEEKTEYSSTSTFNLPIDATPGRYTISVREMSLNPALTTSAPIVNEQIIKLPAPDKFEVLNGDLRWSMVTTGLNYTLSIRDSGDAEDLRVLPIEQTLFHIKDEIKASDMFETKTGNFTFIITTIGTEDSEESDEYYLTSVSKAQVVNLLGTPTMIATDNGQLVWSSVAGVRAENGYALEIRYEEDGDMKVETIYLSQTNFTMEEYEPKKYYFSVKAIGDNVSNISSDMPEEPVYSAIKLGTVENLDISNGKIVFDKLEGAVAYRMKVEKVGGTTNYENIVNNSFSLGGNYGSGDYKVSVQAIGNSTEFGNEEKIDYLTGEFSGLLRDGAVTKLGSTSAYVKNDQITWESVNGAVGYYIRINHSDFTSEQMPDNEDPEFQLENTKYFTLSEKLTSTSDKEYTFNEGVYAVNVRARGGDNYLDGDYYLTDCSVTKLSAVQNLKVEDGIITWDYVAEVPYRLDLYIGDNCINLTDTFLKSWNDTTGGTKDDKTQYILGDEYEAGNYSVVIVNRGGDSENSGALSSNASDTLHVTKLEKPENITINSTTNSIDWDMAIPKDEFGVDIHLKYELKLIDVTTNEVYLRKVVKDELRYVIENLAVGKYNIYIKALVNGDMNKNVDFINSDVSTEDKVLTMPSMPTGLKIENGVISWDEIEGVSGYKLSVEFYEGIRDTNLDVSTYKSFVLTIPNASRHSLSIRDFSEIDNTITHCTSTALGKYKVKIAAYVSNSLQSAYTNEVGDTSENGIQGYYYFNMFANGKGTRTNPYKITSFEQLQNVGYMVDLSYEVTQIIETNDKLFTSIGTAEKPFTGRFNGGNNNISNLVATIGRMSTKDYAGMFGYIGETGVVYNVTLTASSTDYGYYVGALAGYNKGLIYNCKVNNGAIVSKSETTQSETKNVYIGGLVGYNDKNGVIDYCSFTGYVNAKESTDFYPSYAGGIAGYNKGKITQCETEKGVNYGYVFGTYSGGITGFNFNTISAGLKQDGSITKCTNNLDVTCYSTNSRISTVAGFAGGIAGINSDSTEADYEANDYSINNCVSFGNVIADTNGTTQRPFAAGIVGYAANGIFNCYTTGAVYCNQNSTESTNNANLGRVIAYNKQMIRISGCIYQTLEKSDYPELSADEFEILIGVTSTNGSHYESVTEKSKSYLKSAEVLSVLNSETNMTQCWSQIGNRYAYIEKTVRPEGEI